MLKNAFSLIGDSVSVAARGGEGVPIMVLRAHVDENVCFSLVGERIRIDFFLIICLNLQKLAYDFKAIL